jgi:hypothetical protein
MKNVVKIKKVDPKPSIVRKFLKISGLTLWASRLISLAGCAKDDELIC